MDHCSGMWQEISLKYVTIIGSSAQHMPYLQSIVGYYGWILGRTITNNIQESIFFTLHGIKESIHGEKIRRRQCTGPYDVFYFRYGWVHTPSCHS